VGSGGPAHASSSRLPSITGGRLSAVAAIGAIAALGGAGAFCAAVVPETVNTNSAAKVTTRIARKTRTKQLDGIEC
jgi:hypothetical protein